MYVMKAATLRYDTLVKSAAGLIRWRQKWDATPVTGRIL